MSVSWPDSLSIQAMFYRFINNKRLSSFSSFIIGIIIATVIEDTYNSSIKPFLSNTFSLTIPYWLLLILIACIVYSIYTIFRFVESKQNKRRQLLLAKNLEQQQVFSPLSLETLNLNLELPEDASEVSPSIATKLIRVVQDAHDPAQDTSFIDLGIAVIQACNHNGLRKDVAEEIMNGTPYYIQKTQDGMIFLPRRNRR